MNSKKQSRVENGNDKINLALYMNVQVPPAKEQPGIFLDENNLFGLMGMNSKTVKEGILNRIKQKKDLSLEDLSRFSSFAKSNHLTLTWGEVISVIGEDRARTFIASLNGGRAKNNARQQQQQQTCAA